MYRKLIDENYLETYQLIEFCVNSHQQWFLVEELQEYLGLSKFKIGNAIQGAVEASYKYPEYTLSYEKGQKKFSITFQPTFLLSELYSTLLRGTLGFIFLDYIYRNKTFSLEKFAQEHYVSVRTVQRKLRAVNEILNNYYLRIDLRKSEPLIGEEFRIRYYFHIANWQVFADSETNFVNLNEQSRDFIFQKLSEELPQLRIIDKYKFLSILSVSVQRIRQNYSLSVIPQEMMGVVNPYISFEKFKEEVVAPFFKKNFINSKAYGEVECSFLYYIFTVMVTYLPRDLKMIELPRLDLYENNLSSLFIQLFENEFNFTVSKDSELYLRVNLFMINSYSSVFYTRIKMDPYGRIQSIDDYNSMFPKLYNKIENICKKILKSEPEFGQLLAGNSRLIFQYCMLAREILDTDTSNTIRVFVQSKFGRLQEEYQKKIQQLRGNIEITFVDQNEAPNLVVTDYPINRSNYSERTVFFEWGSPQSELDLLDLSKIMKQWIQSE